MPQKSLADFLPAQGESFLDADWEKVEHFVSKYQVPGDMFELAALCGQVSRALDLTLNVPNEYTKNSQRLIRKMVRELRKEVRKKLIEARDIKSPFENARNLKSSGFSEEYIVFDTLNTAEKLIAAYLNWNPLAVSEITEEEREKRGFQVKSLTQEDLMSIGCWNNSIRQRLGIDSYQMLLEFIFSDKLMSHDGAIFTETLSWSTKEESIKNIRMVVSAHFGWDLNIPCESGCDEWRDRREAVIGINYKKLGALGLSGAMNIRNKNRLGVYSVCLIKSFPELELESKHFGGLYKALSKSNASPSEEEAFFIDEYLAAPSSDKARELLYEYTESYLSRNGYRHMSECFAKFIEAVELLDGADVRRYGLRILWNMSVSYCRRMRELEELWCKKRFIDSPLQKEREPLVERLADDSALGVEDRLDMQMFMESLTHEQRAAVENYLHGEAEVMPSAVAEIFIEFRTVKKLDKGALA